MQCIGLDLRRRTAIPLFRSNKDTTIESMCAYDQFALPIVEKTGVPAGHPLKFSLR
jgi:hypothetical protein